MVTIVSVDEHSRAARMGIRAGDILVRLNGHEIRDVLDYRFYLAESELSLDLRRDGKDFSLSLHKNVYDDIGLSFETPLMDRKIRCENRCIFCFIDQLPKGLRETLYFKDDDSRLSFLHGNYITLTNLSDGDIARILAMHLSPVNISVHTTNPDLRVRMMNNKRAGEVLSYLRRLADGGITLGLQIVLCRGINDGGELTRTMRDLTAYLPAVSGVSVVPAGLTRYREGLYPLSSFSPAECREVIAQVTAFGDECLEKYGTRLFYPADEFYVKGGVALPGEDFYEGYPQIENGVGMLTSLASEFASSMEELREMLRGFRAPRRVSVATGVAASAQIRAMCERLCLAVPGLEITVYTVRNHFFGEEITVSGLLTGKDIGEQLAGADLGDELLLPPNVLRSEGDLFLCGMSLEELQRKLGVPVSLGGADGDGFLRSLLGVGDD